MTFVSESPLGTAVTPRRAERGLEGLAERALHALDGDVDDDAPVYVCGESFGGPIALTLARPASFLCPRPVACTGRLTWWHELALCQLLVNRTSRAIAATCAAK